MSYVTLDQDLCQEKVDKGGVDPPARAQRRAVRSRADALGTMSCSRSSRSSGWIVDRDGVERLCAGALSAEEVARPVANKLKIADDMVVNWVWISLLALWQRWWPERVCLELLDDKMQAGYVQDAENDTRAAAVTWLDAWADVLRLCNAAGISSIEEFDERFSLTQFLCNWIQDLEMALENTRQDRGELRRALIDFC